MSKITQISVIVLAKDEEAGLGETLSQLQDFTEVIVVDSLSTDATVEIGRERHPVRARQAEGEERETIWNAVVAKLPDYEEYRRRTTRRIPVVVLERRTR